MWFDYFPVLGQFFIISQAVNLRPMFPIVKIDFLRPIAQTFSLGDQVPRRNMQATPSQTFSDCSLPLQGNCKLFLVTCKKVNTVYGHAASFRQAAIFGNSLNISNLPILLGRGATFGTLQYLYFQSSRKKKVRDLVPVVYLRYCYQEWQPVISWQTSCSWDAMLEN